MTSCSKTEGLWHTAEALLLRVNSSENSFQRNLLETAFRKKGKFLWAVNCTCTSKTPSQHHADRAMYGDVKKKVAPPGFEPGSKALFKPFS